MAKEPRAGKATGHTAQAEIDRLSTESVWIFDIPGPAVTGLAILPVSLLLGLYFIPYDPDLWWRDWPLYSLVFFAAPAWLAALFSYGWLRMIKGKTFLSRTMLLSLVNLFLIGAILIPGKLVEVYLDIPRAAVLVYAYSVLVMINHLGNLMTATPHGVAALPATVAQPVAGFVPIILAYYYEGDALTFSWELPALAVIFLFAFLAAGYIALYIGTRPLMLTFGISGVDVFRAFLDHWTEGKDAGRPELERFFRIFAEPVHAHATVVRFRKRGKGEPIATLVTPSIHPGPWGELGASDLPRRMAAALGDGHGHVLTFHGASDHDLNPITHEEADKVMAAVREAASSLEGYSDMASHFVRLFDDFDACAQAFNGAVMAVHTSSPSPTDDVDGPTGYAIEHRLEEAGASPGVFIDSHNCLEPGVGGISFGTPKSRRLQERLAEAATSALAGQMPGLRVGVGHVPAWESARSMGGMGVQALVVEVGGKRTAWVLLDGNNMVCGLREPLRERLLEHVDEAELLTTDNHVVNVLVGGFNPVGLRDPRERVLENVVGAVEEALDNMHDAEVAAARAEIGDVLVFGRGNTIRLSSAINSAVATAKGAFPAAFAFASVVSAFALWLLRAGL